MAPLLFFLSPEFALIPEAVFTFSPLLQHETLCSQRADVFWTTPTQSSLGRTLREEDFVLWPHAALVIWCRPSSNEIILQAAGGADVVERFPQACSRVLQLIWQERVVSGLLRAAVKNRKCLWRENKEHIRRICPCARNRHDIYLNFSLKARIHLGCVPKYVTECCCCCCCCCCLHIINHPGLSSQYLLLSQPLRTNPTLDSANFRHRLTYLEKVYQNKMDPQGSAGR